MGFSGMPYIVVLSENNLDIALWVKIQDGRYLLKVNQWKDIIFDSIDKE